MHAPHTVLLFTLKPEKERDIGWFAKISCGGKFVGWRDCCAATITFFAYYCGQLFIRSFHFTYIEIPDPTFFISRKQNARQALDAGANRKMNSQLNTPTHATNR
mmetsp:Transcript_5097/g.8812  ORF Transcript_5097/g.8812 Transcript_5097/m.8812 type:complete len:104 (-) Transcript_5097:522-833(-)